MTVPTSPSDVIRQALSDAMHMRRNHPDAGDLQLIATYESARLAIDQARLVILTSEAASHVSPDGTVTLTLTDLLLMTGALRDAALYRRGEECREHPSNSVLAESYAGLAYALGDDR